MTDTEESKKAAEEPKDSKPEDVKEEPKKEEPKQEVIEGEKKDDKSPLLNEKKEEVKGEDNKETKDEPATNGKPEEVAPPAEDKPKTPGTSFNTEGLNSRLSFAVIAAAFGSAFLHGYNLGVLNAPQKLIEKWINCSRTNCSGIEALNNATEAVNTTNGVEPEHELDPWVTLVVSWIVSIYCIGGMIGGSMIGFFSERFGRKGGLLINNAFAILSAFFFGFSKMANSFEMLIIARFIIGINNGLNAGLAPMYLTEIAPANLRGALGTVYQLVVTISILVSQILGIEGLLGTEDLWPVLLALTCVPAIFQLMTMPICPESPKYLLINKEKRLEAQRALTWLRNSSNVHEELEEIQNEAEAQKLVPSVSLREIIMNPALRIPLTISVVMMLAQQLSGINAAIFFSAKIFEKAGLGKDEQLYATIAMGTMNVLMTVVSLVLVERAGRKTLMLVGLSGMAIDAVLLTICLAITAKWLSYASIVLVIGFVVMFATGPGSIPWFLVNELFASNARPTASSIAVAINWFAAFLVGVGFLPIQEAIEAYVFLIFAALLCIFIAFTYFKVPETKGKSIDEITAVFKQQAYGEKGNRV